jgi:SAM-dependent methyltransferase
MPDWRTFYDHVPVERMPWYNPHLDPDLAKALAARGLKGGAFLDLGAGPGTQAIELARLGFDVTGSDISPTAVTLAQERARGTTARFVVDDVLDTRLGRAFDAVFDRGCFHVFDPSAHPAYLTSLRALVAPGGVFFLKCFSALEPGEVGPRRYTPDALRRVFGDAFTIESVEETVYYGNVGREAPIDHEPRSLFAVMRPRA